MKPPIHIRQLALPPDLDQEQAAGDLMRPQRRQVARGLLAIDLRGALVAAQAHQRRQRDLGGVAGMGEHGFAKHRAAQCHAVQAAHQLAVDPGFHAVGLALAVQRGVGRHDAVHDPGAVLAGTHRLGAVAHDLLERGVDAHLAARRFAEFLQRLAQRRVQAEICHLQHHARVGGPPEHGLALAEPGEDALRIGGLQVVGIQPTAGGQQAGQRVIQAPGALHGGEDIVFRKPGQLVGHGSINFAESNRHTEHVLRFVRCVQ